MIFARTHENHFCGALVNATVILVILSCIEDMKKEVEAVPLQREIDPLISNRSGREKREVGGVRASLSLSPLLSSTRERA